MSVRTYSNCDLDLGHGKKNKASLTVDQYGGYNPYGGNGGGRGYGSDPFDDRNAMQYGGGTHEMASFGQGNSPQMAQQGYGSPRTADQTPMTSFSPGNTPQMAQQGYGSPRPPNQNSTLDECIDIQKGIQEVGSQLGVLSALQRRALDDADMTSGSNTKRDIDDLTQSIMDQYRNLTVRLREIKRKPESHQYPNKSQVEKTDRDLKKAIQRFQELEAGSRREMQVRMERQARIVHPDATDAEIAEIVRSDTQIFQQAVLGSRAEQANRVLGAVKQRHQEMLEIEKTLMELLDLLDNMQEMLVKQEEVVVNVEQNAVSAAADLEDSNKQLATAIDSSRAARKKKWWCLGICVLIVVIIVVIVVVYIMVNRAANGGGGGSSNNNNNNNSDSNSNTNTNTNTNSDSNTNTNSDSSQKRSLFQRNAIEDLQMNTARAVKMSSDVAPTRLSRRGSNMARGAKRFVVDWQGIEPTGSDD